MAINEQNAESFPNEIAIRSQFGIVRQQSNGFVELIEVRIRLRPAPFLKTVLPDSDEIAFRQSGLADGPFHLSRFRYTPSFPLNGFHIQFAGISAVFTFD